MTVGSTHETIKPNEPSINRRTFLKKAREMGTSVVMTALLQPIPHIARTEFPEIKKYKTPYQTRNPEALQQPLEPNEHASLTNLPKVPECLFAHSDSQTVSTAINFANMYNRNTQEVPNYFDLGKSIAEGGDREYWQGIINSTRRNQKTYLVIELPGDNDTDVTINDWQKYVEEIARTFPKAYFIIGNEINIAGNRWKQNPDSYAQYYLAAAQTVRDTTPESKVLIYGEAYNEDGETLQSILKSLSNLTESLQLNLSDFVDGVPFHFYDTASKLHLRTNLYQEVLQKAGLNKTLILTEFGKAEVVTLDDVNHANIVTQNLAAALALIEEGAIGDVIWHTAYLLDDPNHHSLTITDKEGTITGLTPAFNAFWETSKLLHHGVTLENQDHITMVRGFTSANTPTIIAWNNETPQSFTRRDFLSKLLSFQTLTLPSEGVQNIYLQRSITDGVEGTPFILTSMPASQSTSPQIIQQDY